MLPGITPALMSAASPGNDSYTTLLIHGDGANGSQAFIDSSPAQHVVGSGTAAGAAITTLQAKFGGSSVALAPNGNGYLAVGTSDFDFGTADFTIDWWEYRLDAADSRPLVVRSANAQTYQPFLVGFSEAGILKAYASSNNASWDILSSVSMGALTVNTWVHFALVRKGTTFYTFRNGVLIATATSALAFPASAGPLCIGIWNITGSQQYNFNGYLDEFRISKTARWTSNFTPSKGPYGPDYVGDSLTKLLMHFDADTTVTDSSPYKRGAATVIGSGIGTTGAQLKFGTGSCVFPGVNQYLQYPDSPDWTFSGDYTIDFWVRLNALPASGTAYGIVQQQGDANNYWVLYIDENSNFAIGQGIGGAVTNTGGPGQIGLNTWAHVAFVRSAGVQRMYLNGVSGPPQTIPASNDVPSPLVIGSWAGTWFLNGYIDELRISKVARWTANFVPPSAPYNPVTTKGPATHFSVTAPASVSVNTPFNITVQALDANNNATNVYSGTVHFTSTDGAAVLPANATLGGGVGTFSVTLKTLGSFTVTATDTVTGSITGSANVTANAMPTIVATATTNNAANTTHSVNLPAGNVGDMLIVFIGGGGITAANGGWTSLDTLSAVYRVATGADALSVTLSGSFTLTAVAYRIRGYAGVPEAVSVTAASVTTIDPPALTPSWGLADNLWFASCIYSYPSAVTLTATPANYGDAIFIPPAIGPNNSAVYTSTRFLRATSDDPGVFNLSAATQPRGRTVAIRGA